MVLRKAGLGIRQQAPIAVWYRGERIGRFRADLLVEDTVLVELKAAKGLDPAHEAQLLNALKATNIEIGLLFNFGPKPQFRRLAFSNTRKNICVHLTSAAHSLPLAQPEGVGEGP